MDEEELLAREDKGGSSATIRGGSLMSGAINTSQRCGPGRGASRCIEVHPGPTTRVSREDQDLLARLSHLRGKIVDPFGQN